MGGQHIVVTGDNCHVRCPALAHDKALICWLGGHHVSEIRAAMCAITSLLKRYLHPLQIHSTPRARAIFYLLGNLFNYGMQHANSLFQAAAMTPSPSQGAQYTCTGRGACQSK